MFAVGGSCLSAVCSPGSWVDAEPSDSRRAPGAVSDTWPQPNTQARAAPLVYVLTQDVLKIG